MLQRSAQPAAPLRSQVSPLGMREQEQAQGPECCAYSGSATEKAEHAYEKDYGSKVHRFLSLSGATSPQCPGEPIALLVG
jgi:hypothetical protein